MREPAASPTARWLIVLVLCASGSTWGASTATAQPCPGGAPCDDGRAPSSAPAAVTETNAPAQGGEAPLAPAEAATSPAATSPAAASPAATSPAAASPAPDPRALARACGRAHPGACAELGGLFLAAPLPTERARGTLARLRLGCRLEQGPACAALGLALERRRRPALRAAAHAYERACELDAGAGCGRWGALVAVHPELTSGAVGPLALYARGCRLGDALSCGRQMFGVAQNDPERAAPALDAGCQAGDAAACVLYGRLLEATRVPDASPEAAETAYLRACEASGDADACAHLGILRTRSGADATAREPLATGCRGGSAEACAELGALKARAGEHRAALRDFERACRAGVARACMQAAEANAQGRGTRPNPNRAARWTARACAAGGATPALCLEAATSLTGPRDRALALPILGPACVAQEVRACAALGRIARGRDRDRFAERACELGDAPSCGRLARAVQRRDPERARPLAAMACEAGEAASCVLAARLAGDPRAGFPELHHAVRLAHRACEAGQRLGCRLEARTRREIESGQSPGAVAARLVLERERHAAEAQAEAEQRARERAAAEEAAERARADAERVAEERVARERATAQADARARVEQERLQAQRRIEEQQRAYDEALLAAEARASEAEARARAAEEAAANERQQAREAQARAAEAQAARREAARAEARATAEERERARRDAALARETATREEQAARRQRQVANAAEAEAARRRREQRAAERRRTEATQRAEARRRDRERRARREAQRRAEAEREAQRQAERRRANQARIESRRQDEEEARRRQAARQAAEARQRQEQARRRAADEAQRRRAADERAAAAEARAREAEERAAAAEEERRDAVRARQQAEDARARREALARERRARDQARRRAARAAAQRREAERSAREAAARREAQEQAEARLRASQEAAERQQRQAQQRQAQQQRQAEAERQRQAEAGRQRQAEAEQQRQAEAEPLRAATRGRIPPRPPVDEANEPAPDLVSEVRTRCDGEPTGPCEAAATALARRDGPEATYRVLTPACRRYPASRLCHRLAVAMLDQAGDRRGRSRAVRVLADQCRRGGAASCGRAAAAMTGAGQGRLRRQLLERGAVGHDPSSERQLARLLADDEAQRSRAIALYAAACDAGAEDACREGAALLGSGDVPSLGADAIVLHAAACQRGDVGGCALAGAYYADDATDGHATDPTRATSLFERGCALHDLESCRRGAALLSASDPESVRRRLPLLAAPCEAGHVESCDGAASAVTTLGPDAPEASEVARRGCAHGAPRSCVLLGSLAREGRHIPRDRSEATRAYDVACGADEPSGCAGLEELCGVGFLPACEAVLAHRRDAEAAP